MRDVNEDGVHGNEDIFHSIFNFFCIQSSIINKIGTQVNFSDKRPDLIFSNRKSQIGIIVEMKYKKTSEIAQEQACKYIDVFLNHKYVSFIKVQGINISEEKIVDINISTCNNF